MIACASLAPHLPIDPTLHQTRRGFSAEEKATFLDLLGRFKLNSDSAYSGKQVPSSEAPL